METMCCRRLSARHIKQMMRNLNSVRGITRTSITATAKYEMSYSQGATDKPLLGATIGNLMQTAASKYGHQEACVSVSQGLRYNFVQLLEKSDELAAGLTALGVERGDRVGIWAPNVMEWILTQYATARAGIILVNINPAYRVSELEYAIKKVGVKVLVATETFKTSNYYKMLQEIIPHLPGCGHDKISSDRLPDLEHIVMISDHSLPGTYRFVDVVEMATNEHKSAILDLQKRLQFDDVINIQFTSGTTGHPKGASLSHHNIVNNAKYVGGMLAYDEVRTRIAMPVPLYHCFGMVLGSLSSLIHGCTLILPSPSFDPEATLKAASDEKCRSMYGTPTMFIDMLESPNLEQYDLSSLSTGVMAGSPCPVEVMKKVRTQLHMEDVTIAYGTTENSPVTFQTAMDAPVEKRVSTVGKAHALCEAKIVDDNYEILPVGQKGELCIRGYVVMRNYWQDPEKTREAIGEDCWYKTGDLAVMDEEGYVQLVGRIKDMIIRGGENIYPTEIEQFLYKHPKISDVQVIGLPDDRLGEQICACIKLKDGESATADDIKLFCKEKIAHFKIPHYILFVSEYPMTVTGKIQKYKMRESTIKSLGITDKGY